MAGRTAPRRGLCAATRRSEMDLNCHCRWESLLHYKLRVSAVNFVFHALAPASPGSVTENNIPGPCILHHFFPPRKCFLATRALHPSLSFVTPKIPPKFLLAEERLFIRARRAASKRDMSGEENENEKGTELRREGTCYVEASAIFTRPLLHQVAVASSAGNLEVHRKKLVAGELEGGLVANGIEQQRCKETTGRRRDTGEIPSPGQR